MKANLSFLEIQEIRGKFEEEDRDEIKIENWKFVAQVFDRFMAYFYFCAIVTAYFCTLFREYLQDAQRID